MFVRKYLQTYNFQIFSVTTQQISKEVPKNFAYLSRNKAINHIHLTIFYFCLIR